jgi:flagellar biosynthesis/type III secretory pathway protein FliH
MASSSDSTAAPSARSFAQRVEQHERVPRIDLPGGLAKPVVPTYARFIPREELGSVAAWVPDSLDPRKTAAAAAPAPAPIDPAVARAARQAQLQQRFAEVFEQGRRQGQEDTTRTMREEARQALDVFRRQQATEVGAPVATLLTQFQQGLDSVEQALARRLAGIAM